VPLLDVDISRPAPSGADARHPVIAAWSAASGRTELVFTFKSEADAAEFVVVLAALVGRPDVNDEGDLFRALGAMETSWPEPTGRVSTFPRR
jgi:hypothetical protein